MEVILIVFGWMFAIVVVSVGLDAWAKVQMARAKGSAGKEVEERLARLETSLEELRDQVAELMIESHDRELLGAEQEMRSTARLRAE